MAARAKQRKNLDAGIYSTRLIKNYEEYLKRYYPRVDFGRLLHRAHIARYELEDHGHWLSQRQVDFFHQALISETGDLGLPRKAGRYAAFSGASGPIRQYVLGFVTPEKAYRLVEKLVPNLSRAHRMKTKKIKGNGVEIDVTVAPGIREKSYQCENRLGLLESVAKVFTNTFAKVEHPLCFHRGDGSCRYVVTWENNLSLKWKRARNYAFLLSSLCLLLGFFFIPQPLFLASFLAFVVLNLSLTLYAEFLQKKELIRTVETQGDAAKGLLKEMNTRYNNALFVQEIGQVASNILDVETLLKTVLDVMKKRLDFDRGMIFLANQKRTRLQYIAGYGYTREQGGILRRNPFHLDGSEPKGIFVSAFQERKLFLLGNLHEKDALLSKKSKKLVELLGIRSLICVPIVYKEKSLGVLAVDSSNAEKPFTKSDVSQLMGVASQTAISIVNAFSFQKLGESEKKYRDLVENANSIILRTDKKGNIIFFNTFAQKFFGYRESEILGKNVVGTLLQDTPETRRGILRLIQSLQRVPQRAIITEDREVIKRGTSAWVAWTYKPIFDEHGNLKEVLSIGNDITALKQAAKENQELERRLQQAQKMEAIGTLAGGVAHDLNNILSGLVSYPELLLMQIPQDSPLRKPILTIQKSGEKAAAIVQDLLTLARRGVSVTDVVNLNEVVSDYLNSPEYQSLMEAHPDVELETRLEEDLLNVMGSPVHLSKTVMNLISNAAEAMPEGGKIVLSTENRYMDGSTKNHDQVEEGDYVVVTISDTGVGIPPEDLSRIFEPFYTKKVMGRSGTGLGMAVVWGTVKDHHGYIRVKSTEGEGTTFNLYFPATREELARDDSLVPVAEYMGRGETVLVVDDVEDQREIASGMLKSLGYSVKTVSSGEEAVDFLKEDSADLVMLDMIMEPGMDGLETYKKILEFRPRQRAIIVSGFSESDRVKDAQELGAGAYVRKPYLLARIGIAVRTELDKDRA